MLCYRSEDTPVKVSSFPLSLCQTFVRQYYNISYNTYLNVSFDESYHFLSLSYNKGIIQQIMSNPIILMIMKTVVLGL